MVLLPFFLQQTKKAIHGMVLAPKNNGTITNFLTSLKHKLLDFDNYRSEPATDAWKCERLDSALLLHPRMNEHVTALQTQAEIFRDQLGDKYTAMTFDAYYAALYNYAMKLDTQTRVRPNSRPRLVPMVAVVPKVAALMMVVVVDVVDAVVLVVVAVVVVVVAGPVMPIISLLTSGMPCRMNRSVLTSTSATRLLPCLLLLFR